MEGRAFGLGLFALAAWRSWAEAFEADGIAGRLDDGSGAGPALFFFTLCASGRSSSESLEGV